MLKLNKEETKDFIRLASPCLRRENPPSPVLKEIEIKKPKPTEGELNLINKGLETGEVNDSLLRKFFPQAYEGVKKYGLYEYLLGVHNKTRMRLPEDIANWCLIHVGNIAEKTDSKYTVETIKGKKIKSTSIYHPDYPNLRTVNEENVKIGSHVLLHRNQIVKILDKNEYETFSNLVEPH